jgi:chloramphenicol 3-O-phosphotransferase
VQAPLLELSTKCKPGEAFQVAAEAKAFLMDRGVNLSGDQQTKTRTALEFYSKQLAACGVRSVRCRDELDVDRNRVRGERGFGLDRMRFAGEIARQVTPGNLAFGPPEHLCAHL